MLKELRNELRCTLTLTATGPLLVKAGYASSFGPDMVPVRTYRGNGTTEPFLPGSSLKGVVRSHVEKICRTLCPGLVCDPFRRVEHAVRLVNGQLVCNDFPSLACSEKFQVRRQGKVSHGGHQWMREREEISSAMAYRESCPICRLFGSTSFIGRVSIGDAQLAAGTTAPTEARDGVGIDRFTGGTSSGAKFDLEVVSAGARFETDILLRNFECWQIGALFVALTDLRDGLIRIGSGRSRGLGAVRGEVSEVVIHTLGRQPARPHGHVLGVGALLGIDGGYGTFVDDIMSVDPAPAASQSGLRRVMSYSGPSLAALESAAMAELVHRLDDWQTSPGLPQWPDGWQQA